MSSQDQFSFSFSGDDIEDDDSGAQSSPASSAPPAQPVTNSSTGTAHRSFGAFPVQGVPLLPPAAHDLGHILSELPSKIAYSLLTVDLDGHGSIRIPRRELWDVRVQLMAEENSDQGGVAGAGAEPGLGKHDVKTGIYEGGFKSWESSVDLVKTLASEEGEGGGPQMLGQGPCRLIELGCGTALPSLALFRWASAVRSAGGAFPTTFVLADYNPTVLYLVTLPNFILTWALQHAVDSLSSDGEDIGELELTPTVIQAFRDFLQSNQITLSFISGAWSPEFVELLYSSSGDGPIPKPETRTLVMGAETIYSPYALNSFTETLLSILLREGNDRPSGHVAAIIAAKRLYFGVGGSLDDFVVKMRESGAAVETLREEAEGVRRGVVRCSISS